jgi:hypothetical protein
MRSIRLAGVVAGVLLIVAGEARAECAWVLWSQTFITASMKEPQLTPMAAYGSKADCETGLAKSTKRSSKSATTLIRRLPNGGGQVEECLLVFVSE